MSRLLLALGLLACASVAGGHPEIEEALTRLNAAIAAAPADAELYLQRGELYAAHADWVAAEANYLRAEELSPALPRLAVARATLELATHRPTEALAHLDATLAQAPDDSAALILRARAHVARQERDGALADFDRALALVPEPAPELWLERAALLEPAAAIRSLDAAIARAGPILTLQLRALALEESLGRTDAAVARLDAIAARAERKELWLKQRGDVLRRAGRAAEARAAYRSALAAIAALPDWLRQSPETVRLAAELGRETASRS